jgi:transcriptional antiterminator NusG
MIFAVNEDTVLYFNIGETIKVIDGPLLRFERRWKINEEKRKLEVMVKIFGRKTFLELFMQVEKYNICYI